MHGEFLGNFLIQHLVTLVPTQIPHNRILLYPGRQLRIVLGDLVSINISPNAWRIFGQLLEKLGNFLIQHLVTLFPTQIPHYCVLLYPGRQLRIVRRDDVHAHANHFGRL